MLVGIDGCLGGWVAAVEEGGQTSLVRLRTLDELPLRRTVVVVVDIPL